MVIMTRHFVLVQYTYLFFSEGSIKTIILDNRSLVLELSPGPSDC
jgi:hypothetical protein